MFDAKFSAESFGRPRLPSTIMIGLHKEEIAKALEDLARSVASGRTLVDEITSEHALLATDFSKVKLTFTLVAGECIDSVNKTRYGDMENWWNYVGRHRFIRKQW